MTVWQMIEVHTSLAHFTPQAIWLPILSRHAGKDVVLFQHLIDFRDESCHATLT